ncbi:hypothetical protein NN561_003751 [Cricetulus griseus]
MQIDPARKGAGTHPGEERPVGEGGGPWRSPDPRLRVLATRVPACVPQCPAATTRGPDATGLGSPAALLRLWRRSCPRSDPQTCRLTFLTLANQNLEPCGKVTSPS